MSEKKCPPKGAPKWTTTFADLSTLLLTFFVLMLSFANIDIEKFRDLLGSVQNAFGVNLEDRGQYMPLSEEESPESADELMDNELKQQQQQQQ